MLINPGEEVDSDHSSTARISSLIHFCSPRIPSLLLTYWLILLGLSMTIFEIRNLFGHLLFPTRYEALNVDSLYSSIDTNMLTKLTIRIWQICYDP